MSVSVLVLLLEAPSQPRNVVCFNVRTTSVGVTWKVPAKINGIKENLKYEIFVQFGTFSYSTKNIIVNSSGTTEHHTVTELTQLSRYSLWIVAFNVRKDGKELTSPRSRVATFTTTGGRKCKTEYIVGRRVVLVIPVFQHVVLHKMSVPV